MTGTAAISDKKYSDSDDLISDIRQKLDGAYQFDRENRREAALDLAFVAGYQWPESIRKERQAAGRPIITINRLPQFIRQVTNDIRQSDLAIKVSPVDDDSDPKLAKIYNGLLRQIHYQSSGKHVYGTAAEHQVACGIGWFRIVSDYVDDEAFEQELRLKAIRNPLSVYCDPGAVEPDRSDASFMIVTEIIPKADFKAKYPKAVPDDMTQPTDGTGDRITWLTRDGVRIAEYWCRKPVKKLIGLTQDGKTVNMDEMSEKTGMKPDVLKKMLGITKTRMSDTFEVEQYIVSGREVLEGPHKWPGTWIPIIPVIGSETPLESATVRHGLIRFARDPQQLYNYNRTAAAETLALQPKSPWLVTAKMISKFKSLWDTANTKNLPYLVYDADPDAGHGPTRQHPPEMPAAFAQEAQIADQDMKATTGIYDSSLGNRSNETSGIAIRSREKQGDTANYHYGDNLQRSMWHAGRILIQLIPKIYDSERTIRVLGEDDSEELHKVNQQVMGMDGVPIMVNDMSAGRFDVRATIGASYSTKRMESADSMMEFCKADPQALPMVRDLIVKSMDWPGAEEMAKRFRNSIPPNLMVDPDAKNPDGSPVGPPPPPDPMQDPQVKVEVDLKAAQIAKINAETAKIAAEAQGLAREGMLPTVPTQPVTPQDMIAHDVAGHDLAQKQAATEAAHHDARRSKANADAAEIAAAHKQFQYHQALTAPPEPAPNGAGPAGNSATQ